MSRYYASIDGSAKKHVTRRGTGASGIHGHVRGWGCGVEVQSVATDELSAERVTSEDEFEIHATSGSNGGGTFAIGRVRLVDGDVTFFPSEIVKSAIKAFDGSACLEAS